jgi:hypothetical protein
VKSFTPGFATISWFQKLSDQSPLNACAGPSTLEAFIQRPAMTTAFNSYSGELVCTPGPAFIDSSAASISLFAGAPSPSGWNPQMDTDTADALAAHHANQSFVETCPPPLTPIDGVMPVTRAPIAPQTPLPQTLGQRFKRAMGVVQSDFPRIHDAIRSMWGTKHCTKYLQTLILNGGSGDDKKNTRVGFKVDTFTALMMLYEMHDDIQTELAH